MSDADNRHAGPNFWQLLVTALFPLLNLCLFVPASIYLDNLAEFEIGLIWLLLPMMLAALLTALLLAAILRQLPVVARQVALSLMFALGLLLWAQGAFLMHDYGALDGRGIDWAQFSSLVHADWLLWLAALLLALLLARRLAAVAAFGATAFIVIQMLPLVMHSDRILADSGELEPHLETPAGIFAYSNSRNIVHVLLDNFQSDIFIELVEESGLEETFDGFTVYPENMAATPHTSLAVPAIVSGRLPDGSRPTNEYYRAALSQGFHVQLLEADYRINLLPMLDMSEVPATNYHPVPNTYAGRPNERRLREALRLLDVSLFSQLPHDLRRWSHNEDNWRFSRLLPAGTSKNFEQRRFLADYIDRIHVSIEDPAYHFLHLWPPHPPFSTDASGGPAGRVLPLTRENYLNEARPMVQLLADFIKRLKALGIYDDSLIIFQSDHGGGFEPEHMPVRLLGLMAIKPPGQRGRLNSSPVQSSMVDVPATVLDLAGLGEFAGPGESIVSLEPGDRPRRFVFMNEGEMYSQAVNGPVDDPASFGPAERMVQVEQTRAYTPGTRVQAGLAGTAGRYLDQGWSSPDDRIVWSSAHEATIMLELPSHLENDLVLRLAFIPNVDPDRHPAQRVGVRVNGRDAGHWVATEPLGMRVKAPVPVDWLDRPQTEIRLILPDAASLAELGTGSDSRVLGVALTSFSLDPARETEDSGPGE